MKKSKLKLNEMSIANGKVWLGDEIDVNHKTKRSLSLASYEEKINKMNLLDLQHHAVENLVPVKEKRESLIASLIKEFKVRGGH
jgi:hypothetical protein